VVWTDRALQDIEAIGDHIGRDSPAAASSWVARLCKAAEKAGVAPLGGRCVPELGRQDIREVFLRTYRVVYLVTAEQVVILTIFEGHRLFPPEADPH
jgi:plasmid stabilization system protein ParE